jgi:ABC-type transport system involved in cytochrome bd biosynthesis fused ATPase/permease subunit
MQNKMGYKIVVALRGIIFKKALRRSASSNKDFKSGEIINQISIDSETIFQLMYYIPTVSKFPFLMILTSIILFYIFGWGFFFGIFILLFLVLAVYF